MLNLKNIKKEVLSGQAFHRLSGLFSHNIKKFIFLLFFILSGYCSYIWYIYIYNPQWSVEKEAEYLKTKDKEVTFNRKKFQDIVEKEAKRSQEYEKTVDGGNDIFRIGQLQSQVQQQDQSQPPPPQPPPSQLQPGATTQGL